VPEFASRLSGRMPAAPGTLVGGQGIGEDFPNARRRLGEEEVEDHGEIVPEPTPDILGFPGQEDPDMPGVHEAAGDDEEEADLVQTPAACPSGHLVEFRSGEGTEFMTVEQVGVEQDDGAGRIVDPGGDGGGGEDGVQAPLFHHGFHEVFPGRQLTAVMGGHPGPLQDRELAVSLQIGEAG